MTTDQILLIKRSWKIFQQVDPNLIGDVFYSKLFTEHPGLKKMFPTRMGAQYKKLIDMLSMIVARLEKIEVLEPEITALAERHVKYGVRPSHFRLVGNALLWTLRQGLGNDWTPEINEAWKACYTTLSSMMMK